MNTTTSPGPAHVAWVCALALGLGYSAKPDEACAQELLAGAKDSVTTLRQARERFAEMAVTDPAAHQRIGRLLDLASCLAPDHTASDTAPAPVHESAQPSNDGS